MTDKRVGYDLFAIPPDGKEPFRVLVKERRYNEAKSDESFTPKLLKDYTDYMTGATPDKVLRLYGIEHVSDHYKGYTFEYRRHLDPKWREREQDRIDGGEYTGLPSEWDDLTPIEDHYCHIALDSTELDMIAFTQDPSKGERDIQTRMKAGRYVKRFYPYLSEDKVRYYASAVQSMSGVQMTDDPELAAEIYENGPESCMAYGPSHWDWNDDEISRSSKETNEYGDPPRHPVAAYFAGDLKLAWTGPSEAATARCLVWPEKKLYGRLYGATERLRTALNRAGYEDGYTSDHHGRVFEGARLRLIRYSKSHIVMPYLDGIDCLRYSIEDKVLSIGRTGDKSSDKVHIINTHGSQGGTIKFRDSMYPECVLSGKEITPNTETVLLDTYTNRAIRSEAESCGYVPTVEGAWTNRPRYTMNNGVREAHNRNWNQTGYVRCVDDIFYLRDECVSVNHSNGYAHKSSDLIRFKGRYYSSVQALADYARVKLPDVIARKGPISPDDWKLIEKNILDYIELHNSSRNCTNLQELSVRDPSYFSLLVNHFDRRGIA